MASDSVEVVLVVTNPPRPAGRGSVLRSTAVAEAAGAAGLPLLETAGVRSADGSAALTALAPDAIVVVAYGELLTPDVLDLPRLGCVNLHFSLLPRWRGAAPVQRAILEGDDDHRRERDVDGRRARHRAGLGDTRGADRPRGRRRRPRGAARADRRSVARRDVAEVRRGRDRADVAGPRGGRVRPEDPAGGTRAGLDALGGGARPADPRARARARLDARRSAADRSRYCGRRRTHQGGDPSPRDRHVESSSSEPTEGYGWRRGPAPSSSSRSPPPAVSAWPPPPGRAARGSSRANGSGRDAGARMSQSARAVAFEAIRRVIDEGGYSTIVVPNALESLVARRPGSGVRCRPRVRHDPAPPIARLGDRTAVERDRSPG